MYLSAVCVCMALCFVGCSKDDDEPGGKGAMYEVTIEQSGDFRSFIKSVVVVANGTQLKDGATGESLASPVILSDEELAVEKVTLSTTGKAIEFQCQIKDLRFQICIFFIWSEHPKNILSCRKFFLRIVDIKTLTSHIMTVCLISIYGKQRKFTDQVQALS